MTKEKTSKVFSIGQIILGVLLISLFLFTGFFMAIISNGTGRADAPFYTYIIGCGLLGLFIGGAIIFKGMKNLKRANGE